MAADSALRRNGLAKWAAVPLRQMAGQAWSRASAMKRITRRAVAADRMWAVRRSSRATALRGVAEADSFRVLRFCVLSSENAIAECVALRFLAWGLTAREHGAWASSIFALASTLRARRDVVLRGTIQTAERGHSHASPRRNSSRATRLGRWESCWLKRSRAHFWTFATSSLRQLDRAPIAWNSP